jgi:hypothetical protein
MIVVDIIYKSFMKYVREQKKGKQGKGFFGDTLKSVGKFAVKEGINMLPAPQFVKNIATNLGEKAVDYGVEISAGLR